VILGNTNDTITGDRTFEPGGGNNVIIGESDLTVILRGSRSEYAISNYIGPGGLVHTLIVDQGTADDGSDDLINVQQVEFADSSLLVLGPSAPLTVTSVGSSQTGTVRAGQTIHLTVAMSEAVTVVTNGGSPMLKLNDNGMAIYDASASNPKFRDSSLRLHSSVR
jgi:hypothetical protein